MSKNRSAFTLIEMLVAMALTLFVMVIISQAFVTALETFSGLKGIGDLQYNLRIASALLQSDLAQDHFQGKLKLSDSSIALTYPRDVPREGFFVVRQGPSTSEGADADGMPCYRGPIRTNAGVYLTPDALYFTIKMRGNSRERFMSWRFPAGAVPNYSLSPLVDPNYPSPNGNPPTGNPKQGPPNFFDQSLDALFQEQLLTYNSSWAEVVWYAIPIGTTDEPTNPLAPTGTPLYALYRATYLLLPNNTPANNVWQLPALPATNLAIKETTESKYLVNSNAYDGVSCFPDASLAAPNTNKYLYFCSPADVTNPNARAINARINVNLEPLPTGLFRNSAVVLNNVVGFNVRWMPVGPTSSSGFTGDYSTTYPNNTALASKTIDSSTQNAGAITAASNTTPIVITSAGHNLPTGAVVSISGVGGNTAANGIYTVTAQSANAFSLNNSAGNGVYTSGGVWTVTGIRALQIIIRIWDPASQQSRQVTLVQDM